MRKAGDVFREGILATNRADPIGKGAFGVVYTSDVPGNVMKQVHYNAAADLKNEVNMQAVAAEMGIAPKVAGLETFAGGVGDRIEMQDIRNNFEPHSANHQFPAGTDAVRVNQQLGALALKGIGLEDRHNGNIVYNKITGRPLQLDFGNSRKIAGEDQVIALAEATEAGLEAAGLAQEAKIYRGIVYDFLNGGQVAEAMDVAKQGFSRLQKIKP